MANKQKQQGGAPGVALAAQKQMRRQL